jgi:hypothetical protein
VSVPTPRPAGHGPLFPGLRAGGVTGAAAGRAWRAGAGGIVRGARTIGARLAAIEATQLVLRTAILTASTSTTATITLGESSITNVNMLASYTPTPGDVVLVLQAPGLMIIIGKAK